jgi:hypothetical protein
VGGYITKKMIQRMIVVVFDAVVGVIVYKLVNHKHKGDPHVRRNQEVVQ